jgi:DTW domain-containing protein YfiP
MVWSTAAAVLWVALPHHSILSLHSSTNMPTLRRLRSIRAMQQQHCGYNQTENSPDDVVAENIVSEISRSGSSLERFAQAVNMTVEEAAAKREDYERAASELHEQLQDPDLSGATKHQLHCWHRYQYGRQPFVCSTCWPYLPVCICKDTENQIYLRIGDNIICSVIVWTHHKEWGSPSNTGSVLSVALGPEYCSVLMKGLDEHDRELQVALCQRTEQEVVIPVVLWTENDNSGNHGEHHRRSFTIQQLSKELKETAASAESEPTKTSLVRIVLIAVEGTWGHARRMVTKLPASIRVLQLCEQRYLWVAHWWFTTVLTLESTAQTKEIARDNNE